MKQVLWGGAGGFLGAILRYGVTAWLPHERLGMGTLAVNVMGCLAIGLIAGWTDGRGNLDPQTRALLVIGVLGSFTTFSAFGNEVTDALREGRALMAGAVVAAHLFLGIGAVIAGRFLAQWSAR